MFKIVLIIGAVLLLAGMGFFFMLIKGPDVEKYAHLHEPQIRAIPDSNVLEVAFHSPTDGLKEVFGFLFKSYFKIKGVPKMPWKMPPSAARYQNELDFDMEDTKREAAFKNMMWEGVASLPLPANISSAPAIKHVLDDN